MKQAYLVIIVSLIFISACVPKKDYSDLRLKKIKVYKTAFGINYPIPIRKKDIKEIKPYEISDVMELKIIRNLLSSMQPYESTGSFGSVYLLAEIKFSNGKSKDLLYNKSYIYYDGKNYMSEELIKKLITLYPEEFYEPQINLEGEEEIKNY